MSELGPDARSILDAARDGDEPTVADRARVRSALTQALAGGGAAAPSAGGAGVPSPFAGDLAAKAGAASPALKMLATLTMIGAVGAALLLTRSRPAPPPPVSPASPAVAADLREPREPAEPLEAPVSASRTPSADAPPAPAAASSAVLPVDAPAASARSAAPRDASTPPAPLAPPSAAPAGAPLPAAEDPLPAEIRRLREVHGALKGGDPGRALALLDESSTANPQGQLREERSAARVLALCKLGRTSEATVEAARFLRESPRSPLADRVRASCATARTP